ncbi:MAG: hypothetical protein V1709_03610 [Planctomycetota bacterium]
MAFSAAGFQNCDVGPTKLFIYYTTDTLTSGSIVVTANGLNTTNCPGLSAGDIVMVAHNTNALLAIVRITAITAATCTYTGITALA